MPNLGFPEIMIILVVALLVFGPKKLPDLGRSLGNGIRGGGRSDTRQNWHPTIGCLDRDFDCAPALCVVEIGELASAPERSEAVHALADQIRAQTTQHLALDPAFIIDRRDEIGHHPREYGHFVYPMLLRQFSIDPARRLALCCAHAEGCCVVHRQGKATAQAS